MGPNRSLPISFPRTNGSPACDFEDLKRAAAAPTAASLARVYQLLSFQVGSQTELREGPEGDLREHKEEPAPRQEARREGVVLQAQGPRREPGNPARWALQARGLLLGAEAEEQAGKQILLRIFLSPVERRASQFNSPLLTLF